MKEFRFATFNIGSGISSRIKECNKDIFDPIIYISELINDNDLDIICFQEILISSFDGHNMNIDISSKTDLHFYEELELSSSPDVNDSTMGLSILSKYPILSKEIFLLKNPEIIKNTKSGALYKSHEKGFLITTIDIGIPICIITGHVFPFHFFNRKDIDFLYIYNSIESKLLQIAEERDSIIIGADFNSNNIKFLMPRLSDKYHTLLNTPTRPNGRNDDYILYSKNLSAKDAKIIKGDFDHYACMGVFNLY